MRLDTLLALMEDGADREIVLEFLNACSISMSCMYRCHSVAGSSATMLDRSR